MFRLLPPGPGPDLIHAAIPADAGILDLGCGAGRLAHPLANLGHPVVGVDIAPAMLASVSVPCLCADIRALPIARPFDVVLLSSYLVNELDGVLSACRRQVSSDGAVIVQRYSPAWAREAVDDSVRTGDVVVAVHDFAVADARFEAVVTYTIGDVRWDQSIDAALIDDLGELAAAAGLKFERWLDEFETWGYLSVASTLPS